MTQGHPDPDDLADLAAEVLDDETSAVLREHVGECDECAGLLDDAARMRSLLLADDPGPMPDEVWTRIEVALAAEAAQLTPAQAPAVQGADGVSAAAAGSAGGVTVLATGGSDGAAGDAAGAGDGRTTPKLRRPVRQIHPTRRQQRQDHAGRWGGGASSFGWGGLVAIAAGVLVVVGLGATLLQGLLPDDSDVAAGMIAQDGQAERSTALRNASPSVIVSTGTDYRPGKLTAQVRELVAKVHGDDADVPSAAFAGEGARTPGENETGALGGARDLPAGAWSSRELARCLEAINAEDLSPIAVDFATFDGREVALLVLPSPAQQYEVWAVSRSCSPGADGTQFFQIVKP